MEDAVFKAKLQSVMCDNKFDRRLPKRRRGKIDTRSLWRVAAGAENVFTEKQARKNKEYSVVLVTDESGSMRGNKYDAAVEFTKYLARSLDAVGVNFAVVGYNCSVVTHKQFITKMNTQAAVDKLEGDMDENLDLYLPDKAHKGDTFAAAQGNHDFDALQTGYELLTRRAYGKILVYMTDGSPHCDFPNQCGYDEEKHKTENIRALVHARKDVTTVAVGILTKGKLDKIFDSHIVVNNLSEFKQELVGALHAQIKRG